MTHGHLWHSSCTSCGEPIGDRDGRGLRAGVCWVCRASCPAPAAGVADCGDPAGSALATPDTDTDLSKLPSRVASRLLGAGLVGPQQLAARDYLLALLSSTSPVDALLRLAECEALGIPAIVLISLVGAAAAHLVESHTPDCPGCVRRDEEIGALRFRVRNMRALSDELAIHLVPR